MYAYIYINIYVDTTYTYIKYGKYLTVNRIVISNVKSKLINTR